MNSIGESVEIFVDTTTDPNKVYYANILAFVSVNITESGDQFTDIPIFYQPI